MVRKEMAEIKGEMRKREEEWNKDREVLKESMREIEKRVREIEVGGEREVLGEEGGGRGGKELEERVKELERRWELKEREERWRNIMVKEIMVKDEEKREAVEEILRRRYKEIGAKVRVEEVRKLKGFTERGTEMVWAR